MIIKKTTRFSSVPTMFKYNNNLDIKRIVFSSKDNTFISDSPKNLKIQHTSAGNKFLKKEEIKNQELYNIKKKKK